MVGGGSAAAKATLAVSKIDPCDANATPVANSQNAPMICHIRTKQLCSFLH